MATTVCFDLVTAESPHDRPGPTTFIGGQPVRPSAESARWV
jgi:hypothetical protein